MNEVSSVDRILHEHPVEMLQNLVRIDTTNPPGNEVECVSYIDDLLTKAGFETLVLAKDRKRPNLITRLKGGGHSPPLMLSGHVDVVTTAGQKWTHPPFEARIVDGFVWGRGTLDMKAGVAMMLSAIMRAKAQGLRPAGDIVLAILCDEEAGSHYGARYLVENHPEHFHGIRYAVSEFGGYTSHVGPKRFYPIQIAEKQICRIRATVRGPGGHGARPMRGGAMAKLADLLRRLDKNRLPVHVTPVMRQMVESMASNLPFPKAFIFRRLLNPPLTNSILGLMGDLSQYLDPLLHNTVNATIVRGGEKVNVIPSEVSIDMDGRLLPGFEPDDMLRELRGVLGSGVELELLQYEPYPAQPDLGLFHLLGGILKDMDPGSIPMPLLLPAFTDACIFSRLGIQTYGFTPMKLPKGFNFFATIHAADERIPVEAVEFGADAIYMLLQRYGSGQTG